MTTAQGTLLNFAYDNNGQRTDVWFATNSTNTTWSAHTHTDYDIGGRIKRLWTSRNSSDTTRVSDVSYCYSPYTGAACPTTSASTDTDLIQWRYDNLTATRTTYAYTNGRLTGATAGATSYTYGYDARGNRTTSTNPAQTFTFNPGNQITSSGYAHDAAGNLTTDPTAGTLTYNGAEQMTNATAGSTGYTYAGTDQNELVHQDLSTDVDYIYGRTDQNGLPLIQSIAKGSSTYYLDHDPLGTPLVFTNDSGTENFYALDNLGSPVALVNTNNVVTATYTYDPWGAYTTTSSTGSPATMNPYRYAGGVYDRGAAGWIKYGQRWYNPTTGRFTQQDSLSFLANPAEGNRYAYAADNPINYTDPTGMFGWRDFWNDVAIGATIGTAVGAVGGCVIAGTVSFGVGCPAGAAAGLAPGAALGLAVGTGVGIVDGWGE